MSELVSLVRTADGSKTDGGLAVVVGARHASPSSAIRGREAAGEDRGQSPPGTDPTDLRLLVLLHGRGADEHDLWPLLDLLDPERRLLGITVGAPLRLPPGGKHWYALGGIPTPDPTSFHETAPKLAAFLDGLPAPLERVVLGGFSQGAVMSWALALGPGRPRPAAIVAMSGFLPQVERWPLSLADLDGYPVAIAHGSADPVIPASFGRTAADTLAAAGADVLRLETAVPHTVDPAWLEPLRAFVAGAIQSRR